MSKELRAAAERLRACQYAQLDNADEQKWSDLELVKDAYLAEYLADDDELVTEEWLRSVVGNATFTDVAGYGIDVWAEVYNQCPCLNFNDCFRIWVTTRGQVRQLFSSLGSPLSEGAE